MSSHPLRFDGNSPTAVRDVTLGGSVLVRRDVGRFRISLARFDAGFRIPSHYHERACVSLILEGRFVQSFPGAEYECPPGGLLVKPPGERHDDRWGTAPARHVIIEPDPASHAALGPVAGTVERIGFRLDPWALGIGRRMESEMLSPDDISDLALEAMALELLVRLHRGAAESGDASPPAWLERVRARLRDGYAEGVQLQDLAEEAGVHPSQLSRKFRACYGMTPAAYLRRLRLRRAMDDLAAGRGSLSSVAHRHGFADQSHLTRSLKGATGLTPAVYRTHGPGGTGSRD